MQQFKSLNIAMRTQKDALVEQAAPAKGQEFKLRNLAVFSRPDGSELYQYEGKPILEIGAPEYVATQADDHVTVTAKMNFKFLGEDKNG